MITKEAIETLKQFCDTMADCRECPFYDPNPVRVLNCKLTQKPPNRWEIKEKEHDEQ